MDHTSGENLEEATNNNEEPLPSEEAVSSETIRSQRSVSCHTTGFYVELLRRQPPQDRTDEQTVAPSEQNTLVTLNTSNPIRASITALAGSLRVSIGTDDELDQVSTAVQPSGSIRSTISIPRIPSEGPLIAEMNHTHLACDEAPPSYTSLPPPMPAFGLQPTFQSAPPPSYEQTFGLRYLDRDQPVLVFNTENMWGYRPQLAYCLYCNAMVLTTVRNEFCRVTHVIAVISFLLCCWPCCFLPYIIPALKEANHHCPACNHHLGTYHPLSRAA